MKPRSWISFLLIELPCLALVAWGFGLQPTPQLFPLTAEKMTVAPADAGTQAQGFDTTITMRMRPHGDWPQSLQQHFLKPTFFRPGPTPLPAGQGPELGLSTRVDVLAVAFQWPRAAKSHIIKGIRYDAASVFFYAECPLNLKAVPQELGRFIARVEAELFRVNYQNANSISTKKVAKAHSSVVVRP